MCPSCHRRRDAEKRASPSAPGPTGENSGIKKERKGHLSKLRKGGGGSFVLPKRRGALRGGPAFRGGYSQKGGGYHLALRELCASEFEDAKHRESVITRLLGERKQKTSITRGGRKEPHFGRGPLKVGEARSSA